MYRLRTTILGRSLAAPALFGLIAAVSVGLPAQAGVNDPLQLLYIYPSVRDNGGAAGTGVATSFHCTNVSGQTEKIQFIVFNFDSSTKANLPLNIGQLQQRTASTHDTVLYAEDLILNTGVVNQGTALLLATHTFIFCTAHILDASAAAPQGIDLHGVRFNPIGGTLE